MSHLKQMSAGLLALTLLSCTDRPDSILSAHGDNRHIDVSDEMGPVLRYQILPLDRSEVWRANYLHPVFAPGGAMITENAPADHIHHRGIFWSWRELFVGDERVGDAWVGEHISYKPVFQSYGQQVDGSVKIETGTLWQSDKGGELTAFIREDTTLTLWPDAENGRRLHIRVALTALVPDVRIAGSDNEKGYGGLSFRFGRADRMQISSGGDLLTATPEPVMTGDEVSFIFPDAPVGWPQAIDIACRVNGTAWQSWILRQELSMQNCAWPGRTPANIATDRATILEADILIRP